MEIKYDVPIEVTEKQYNILVRDCCGIIAHRKSDGKFYIKVWVMKYKKLVQQIIGME